VVRAAERFLTIAGPASDATGLALAAPACGTTGPGLFALIQRRPFSLRGSASGIAVEMFATPDSVYQSSYFSASASLATGLPLACAVIVWATAPAEGRSR
jgi:hypothetical protein